MKAERSDFVKSLWIKVCVFIAFCGFVLLMIDNVAYPTLIRTLHERESISNQSNVTMVDQGNFDWKRMERRKCDAYMMKGMQWSGTLMFAELITTIIETVVELYPEYFEVSHTHTYHGMNRLDLKFKQVPNSDNGSTVPSIKTKTIYFSAFGKHKFSINRKKLNTIIDKKEFENELHSQYNKYVSSMNDNFKNNIEIDFDKFEDNFNKIKLTISFLTGDTKMKQLMIDKLIDGYVMYYMFKENYDYVKNNFNNDNNGDNDIEINMINVWDIANYIESNLQFNMCYFVIVRDPRDRLLSKYNKMQRKIENDSKSKLMKKKEYQDFVNMSKDSYAKQFIDDFTKDFNHYKNILNDINDNRSILNIQYNNNNNNNNIYTIEKWFDNIKKRFSSKNCCIKSNFLEAFYEDLISNQSIKMIWIDDALEFLDLTNVLKYDWQKTKKIRSYSNVNGHYIDHFSTIDIINSIMQAIDTNRFRYATQSIINEHIDSSTQVCKWQQQLSQETQEYINKIFKQELTNTTWFQFYNSFCQ